ncbi:TPA: hypothetical protein DIU27_05515 [Candidatus Collierbacteria bacterium]|uniref:Uncharacterized protein n=1 Tax=Candidatus Collierbacteria bacterium GW2011_GWB2_44_22 TaxID=1618387 RepID=A0A0G1K6H7_9BACT|nr:MAG: hypothetical protein UW31_C0002G0073 [Candidatus Collierbacteria bacterium GW2011_GWA2_44_13]KKT51932.1 MAG: hypothetical protein UW44_C0006G0050 [Candidatus Collierbacteria bacterium GW2011_GWB2_44_22]KKT68390.1 MAG: hypothetical protein UW64_C0020G0009 [Microgenomates group bacterium GW2011_GWC1_44_37]KKT87780.1 MAG: hypothetical protein UW88_C0021G0002 [Candidatus Collierbacteria bacterium GW2011_GWD2_45_10]HCQ31800.1 hypothetical protein [Candidatus Collierbacteria bacterium]
MKLKHINGVLAITILLLVLIAIFGSRQIVTTETGLYYPGNEDSTVGYVALPTEPFSVLYLEDAFSVYFPEGQPASGTSVECTIIYRYFFIFPLDGKFTITVVPSD